MRLRFLLCAIAPLLAAQSLADFEKRVTEFTLANGMHFIILERHEAPVVSFHSYVNAGAVNDPSGQTGIAHMFEHMAFKGTETIGTKDYPAEKKAMDEVERIYDLYDAERAKGSKANAERLKALQADLKAAEEKADSYVIPNAFPKIIEENGGVGLNAGTGEDATQFFYSLPSNRLELWFLLEAERFYDPVFREFYKERDVVREEIRMRVESNPQGRLVQMLTATAFAAHPYRNGPGGWASDIEHFRVPDAVAFYRKYYVPANITIGIAGDVNPAECKRLAEKYFAVLPKHPLPEDFPTTEPPQDGPKSVQVQSPAQPFAAIVYKRPDDNDKDDPVFDIISEVLSGGRTSWMYTDMVRDKRIALAAGAQSPFPGGKYPNLFLFYLVPNSGHTLEENEKECYAIIERLKTEKVDDETLKRIKTRLRASLIRQLDNNAGLAAELTTAYVEYGDWRKLFTQLDDYDKVTADDIQRVARQYFIPDTRTVAEIVPPRQSSPAPAPAGTGPQGEPSAKGASK
ncbi:MAG TPA: pitrilysin family protein [Bryobacteraceae bacterium]|nr:pitrilysin family protein [Bryobacteraceae bacterium]